jgi:hypothetical protein
MQRSYEVRSRPDGGWKLVLFEDGEEAGGGVGEADDYDFLIEQGEDFCGTEKPAGESPASPSC